MARDKLKGIRISGIACCVPPEVIRTDDFKASLGERSVEKFKKTTGIYQRYGCKRESVITAGDLCCAAAERLLKEKNIDRDSIDAVLFITQSPDYRTPATACVLQYRLGLSRECIAYDINLGCSGYPYGLHAAGAYLQSGFLKKVLLLTGDTGTHADPIESMLFGDAGTATLLEYDPEQPDMAFLLRTQGEGFRYLISPYGQIRHLLDPMAIEKENNYVRSIMDGAEIFNFSIREVPELIQNYMEVFDCKREAFDLFAFHQANKMILQQIIKRSELPKEKCPISIDIYGNTSSASAPLTICDYFNRRNPSVNTKERKRIAVCGYGIGLSWGITSFYIKGEDCLPITITDEAYEDGIV